MYRGIYFDEFLEMTRLDEFFDFVLQSLASFGCMAVVAIILAMFGCIAFENYLLLTRLVLRPRRY